MDELQKITAEEVTNSEVTVLEPENKIVMVGNFLMNMTKVNREPEKLTLYKICALFIIGCTIGGLIEPVFVLIKDGDWMRRSGMLYGPLNQVYGLGAVLITLILNKMSKYGSMVIFVGSAFIGSAFEYICSLVQQYVFGSVSWEYSDKPFNLAGRTSLTMAVMWGILGLLFISNVWPFLNRMIDKVPLKIGHRVVAVIMVLIIIDLSITGLAVWRASERSRDIPATNVLTKWVDKTYPNDVMAEKFPSMHFVSK